MTISQQTTVSERPFSSKGASMPVDTTDAGIYEIYTKAAGPEGALPLDPELLLNAPSGDLFAMSQNVGMGWNPDMLRRKEFLILSTQGGIRAPDGTPIALGYHTGHWEVGLLMQAAAKEFTAEGAIPFAGFVTDPCDGRSQGTTGMFDSLPYRNDAALVLRRLVRSLPTRKGIMGVATCDKGLPAMLIALAAQHDMPTILVPGGVTLPAEDGEDAGKAQTIGVPHLCVAWRWLSIFRNSGDQPGGDRSLWHEFSPLGVGALWSTDLARHGPPFGYGPHAPASQWIEDERHSDRRCPA